MGEGLTVNHLSVEMMLRYLAGWQEADALNDPTIVEQFEWQPPGGIVPSDFLWTAIQDARSRRRFIARGAKTDQVL